MSFNGAALRGARKLVSVRRLASRAEMLQWGRAPRSAETENGAMYATANLPLQWGRAPRSAETTPFGRTGSS